MKCLFLILVISTGLMACNQSYKFDQASIAQPIKEQIPDAPPNPPIAVTAPECTADYQQWISDGTSTIQCPQICADGTILQCIAQIEKQLICENGTIKDSTITRIVSIGAPQTSCPAPPELTKAVSEFYDVPATTGKADVLIILDTSGSMSTTLTKLAKKMTALTSKWGKIDWQIGITNAGLGTGFWRGSAMNGKLMTIKNSPYVQDPLKRTILTRNTDYANYYFEQSLTWPINMLSDERSTFCSLAPFCMDFWVHPEPLRTIMTTLNEPANAKLFRSGSYFIPIIISDVDENERGAADATSAEATIKYYKETFGAKMKDMVGFSVVIRPGDSVCLKKHRSLFGEGTFGKYGVIASNFSKLTGGDSYSLCDENYANHLAKIGDRIREKIESITIKQTPIDGTLQISFAPTANIGWTLTGNKITFDRELPAGTHVNITYKVKK